MSATIRTGRKEQRDLVDWAIGEGWSVRHTGSGHLRFLHPKVRGPVFTPSTPRVRVDHKAYQKLRTALRRAVGDSV